MARCLERVRKDRERAVHARRRSRSIDGPSDGSSDGPDDAYMDYEDLDADEDESDEAVMQDELFRRIMRNAEHRSQHAYRVSYALEVGSSVDPDMEDVAGWENELRETTADDVSEPLVLPDDLDQQELEEYAVLAEFADLDDLPDDWWAEEDDTVSYPPVSSSSPSMISAGTSDFDMN